MLPYSVLCAVLGLSSWCLVIVVWLFLAVPWVFLQFLIVVFPDHTHYFLCTVESIPFLYLDLYVLGDDAWIT